MDPTQVLAIYNAYNTGQMSDEEKTQYEADVNAGTMQLPEGASLTSGEAPPTLPMGVIQAYQNGDMTITEMTELEKDIDNGEWTLPEGTEIVPQWQQEMETQGLWGNLKEQITGKLRETKEIKSLPDVGYLPEMGQMSWASIKSAAGRTLSSTDEFLQILKTQYPDIEIREDSKGNPIIKSTIDGKEYAIKPGFKVSDIPRLVATAAAFTPQGKLKNVSSIWGIAARDMAIQSGIEATQASIGGEVNPEEVLMAGAGAAGMEGLSKVGGKVISKIKGEIKELPRLTVDELADVTRKAAKGDKTAQRLLASQAQLDQEALIAAKELGVEDYLQLDHLSSNQAYRDVSQAIKNIPDSTTKKLETEGLEKLTQRADELINELGGTTDLSTLDKSIKGKLQSTHDQLYKKAQDLYSELEIDINPKSITKTTNITRFLKEKADNLGGEEYLSTIERKVLKQMSGDVPYARLEQLRKDITAARYRKEGVFKDADSGLLKKLEKELKADQRVAAEEFGVLEQFDLAQSTAAAYKGIQDDMTAIFGKNLDNTLVSKLVSGTKGLTFGDISKLNKLLSAESLSKDMRKEIMASGLSTSLKKHVTDGTMDFNGFSQWYEGLMKQDAAANFVFANLDNGAKKSLDNLYKVSKKISEGVNIKKGRLRDTAVRIQNADTLISNVYRKAEAYIPGMVIISKVGLKGMGLAHGITSALLGRKPQVLSAADDLISSPEFIKMAIEGTEDAAKLVAKSQKWKTFYKAIGSPKELSSPEQWILTSWQTARNLEETKE